MRDFDIVHTFFDGKTPKVKSGKRANPKYWIENKVKDKYVNENWTGEDTPKAKWKNEKNAALSDLQKETIEQLKALMAEAYGMPDHSMFQLGLIPQIEEAQSKSVTETLRNLVRLEVKERESKMTTDSRDRKLYLRGDLAATRRGEGEVSTDLRSTIADFVTQARAAKASNTIETFSLMTRNELANMELTKKKGIRLSIKEGAVEKTKATVEGARSNSMDALEHVLEGYLGEGWQTPDNLDKYVGKVMEYTSFMGIALNPSAWVNNYMYGELMQILEMKGGDQFSKASLNKARKAVMSNIVELAVSRDKKTVPKSKLSTVLHFFDATMDQRELPETSTSYNKVFDKMYFGQNFGELTMQSQVVLAIMYETKVTLADGTETNLYEAIERDGETRNVLLPEGAVIHMRDGTTQPLTMQALAAVKTKTVSVLQRIHGAYNSEDMGRFHRRAIGRAALQFRKWMPQGLKRRFGADRYSEAREMSEIGYYRALWNNLIVPSVLGNTSDKRMRFLATYNSQPAHVQKAIKRSIYEMSMGAVAVAMGYLLSALIEIDSDDDDELWIVNDEFYKAKLLFHTDRLAMEINGYTPWGMVEQAMRIGQDPMAALRQVKTIAKLMEQVGYGLMPGVDLETFKGGVHYGDLKFWHYLKRATPGGKHWFTLADSIESYEAYRSH